MLQLKNKELIFAVISSAIFFSFTSTISLAGTDEEPDYTSQQAWEDGMQSGAGNFMANCVTCHGPEGKGDGVLADSLDTKPSDLSNESIISTRSDEYLIKVIENGGVSVGLSESMPPWGTTFSDEEIRNVVQHIRDTLCKCKFKGKIEPE